MRIPNAERAYVERAKITEYLLSDEHVDGRHKAVFFLRFGFTAEHWQTLRSALLTHIQDHEVAATREDAYGVRYTVEGPLTTPDGRNPGVRTVWMIKRGEDSPQFVSAYPL